MTMLDATSLLIVEDDATLRERLAAAFTARGLDVRTAGTAADAERLATEDPPELVILDLRVGQDHGLALIPVFLDCDPATRIVVLTGYGSIATAVEAVKRGARHYLTKPADADEILAALTGTDTGAPRQASAPMSLDRVEWEHINRVLAGCGQNVSEAARVLGLHRRTLQRKLAKFPVNR
jgi:two-component system response regulator RegA